MRSSGVFRNYNIKGRYLIKFITPDRTAKILTRASGKKDLKKSLAIGIAIIFILTSPYFMQFFPISVTTVHSHTNSYAQAAPSGTCFPNGPTAITTATFWQNLQCIHSGTITINGTGSLTLVNSSLVQQVVNATPSNLNLSSYARLILQSSTINMGGIGSLLISGNASATFVTSGLVNSSVVLSNVGKLSANATSLLDLTGLNSTSLSSMVFSQSTVNVASRSFTFLAGTTLVPVRERGIVDIIGNSTMELTGSTFGASNSSSVHLDTLHALILNSRISNYNVSNFSLGNSTLTGAQTIIENSQVLSGFTANVTIGSPLPGSTQSRYFRALFHFHICFRRW